VNEAKVLRTIEHPNIVGFRGYLESEGKNPVLLMEKGDHSLLDLIEDRSGPTRNLFRPNEIMKVRFKFPFLSWFAYSVTQWQPNLLRE
jgi:PDZ-binding kinase